MDWRLPVHFVCGNMIFYIYKITENCSGRIYIGKRAYIGDDITKDTYIGSGNFIKQLKQKYGNFVRQYITKDILEVTTISEIDTLEKYYISKYRLEYANLSMNITSGGNGCSLYGKYNASYDGCVYIWYNINVGIVHMTQYDFKRKYNINSSKLLRGGSINGWVMFSKQHDLITPIENMICMCVGDKLYWKHINGEVFIGSSIEFITKYNFTANVSNVAYGRRKSTNGWYCNGNVNAPRLPISDFCDVVSNSKRGGVIKKEKFVFKNVETGEEIVLTRAEFMSMYGGTSSNLAKAIDGKRSIKGFVVVSKKVVDKPRIG